MCAFYLCVYIVYYTMCRPLFTLDSLHNLLSRTMLCVCQQLISILINGIDDVISDFRCFVELLLSKCHPCFIGDSILNCLIIKFVHRITSIEQRVF